MGSRRIGLDDLDLESTLEDLLGDLKGDLEGLLLAARSGDL